MLPDTDALRTRRTGDTDALQAYDSIIIGGGHNGLVCAAYLARAGQQVLLLEANSALGGLASRHEFHPGYAVSIAHTISHFSATIAQELELARHGYAHAVQALPTIGLDAGGNHIHLAEGAVSGVSEQDRRSYQAYRDQLGRMADALSPFWLKTIPRIGAGSLRELLTFAHIGLKLRLLGKADMREFLRIAALPARDLMDENFDSDLLKAVLAWDGLLGSSQAPRSPNNTVLTLLYRMSGMHRGDHGIPAGGIQSLVTALAASAEAAGARLRSGAPVRRILIDADEQGLRAHGVELEDGSQLLCKRVICATDPQRAMLQLVGAENLEIEFANRIRRVRSKGLVAKLHLALDTLPAFTGLAQPHGRMIIAADMDRIEFAYDDAKYGSCPQVPVMEVLLPSLQDATLAPPGKHVLSAHVMYVPYNLQGGWDAPQRQALQERLLDTLETYAPGLRNTVVHAELLTPADLEAGWNVTGGHWHHGEFALDQMLMMRPTFGAAQYATPIPGLHLCSAGSHPAGDLVGAAGHNAARVILQ